MFMRNVFYLMLLGIVLLASSCTKQYRIQGNSTVQDLDGRMLFLKVVKNGALTTIDSCEVVHGKFQFSGKLDSVMMANLFMDETSVMPLVLEDGNIKIQIDQTDQSVSGGMLNESLYEFIHQKSLYDNLLAELPHRESQMIMDGMDHDLILVRLNREAEALSKSSDSLVVDFISRNFDNVLGPGVFMILTSAFPYPIITPQIDSLMQTASDSFKNDAYVSEYMQVARENMEMMIAKQRQELQQAGQ